MKKIFIFALVLFLLVLFPFWESTREGLILRDLTFSNSFFVISEKNSLVPSTQPFLYEQSAYNIQAIITAYSSSPDETWGDPFITASGERVRHGIVANNCLPFGTIVSINGEYFEVLDRKNSRYDCEWFDIWKPSKQDALNFGIQKSYAEILEN